MTAAHTSPDRLTPAEGERYRSGRWLIPVNHDHVGSTEFTASTATCGKCGAEWHLAERGWVCVESGAAP